MRHEEAWKQLPDLLDDRSDAELLAHVGGCARCQRQLFLLTRVDRLLRDEAATRQAPLSQRAVRRGLVAAVAVIAAAAAALALLLPRHTTSHEFTLRTASGRMVAHAVMGHSDARNVLLAFTARDLPVAHGHMFMLWAGDGNRASMQVGWFMVDRRGRCRVRFNLPDNHGWSRFWVTHAGAVVAST